MVANDARAMVREKLPIFPSLVAVISTVPDVRAETRPSPLTVAVPLFPLAHIIGRPVRALPPASRACPVSWIVLPALTVDPLAVTVTLATGSGSVAPEHET